MIINRTVALPIWIGLLQGRDADCCFSFIACLTATSDPTGFLFFLFFPQALIFCPKNMILYLIFTHRPQDTV